MTCSIYKTRHHSRRLSSLGTLGIFFHRYIYIYMSNYNIAMHIPPFPVHQERPEWVDGIESVQMR
jgi:hypothetical protein